MIRSILRKMSNSTNQESVLFQINNNSRIITLNRVSKLNSLNKEMVDLILPRLIEYSKSNLTKSIILNSNSLKALCAGGDVAQCAVDIDNNEAIKCANYFQYEYNLDYLIATLPKPYISLMDNITMGGGVGLSIHAPFRVATERTKLAMPEMDIGFFPDVGTTFFLPKLDDKIGYYYALTGKVLKGLEVYFSGFATHYVNSSKLNDLTNKLSLSSSFQQVNEIIKEFEDNSIDYIPPFSLKELKIINNTFSKSSIEEVFDYLQKDGSSFAIDLLSTLNTKPISSLKVAFALLKKGESNTIRNQFELEMISATNIVNLPKDSNDFLKGVKHKLIDKIKDPFFPTWSKIESNFVEKILKSNLITSKQLNQPLLNKFFGIDYNQYPYHFGLPSNQQVAEYITGNDGLGRSYLPTPKEVVNHFKKLGKLGAEKKVEHILEMHGDLTKYDGKYVSWRD